MSASKDSATKDHGGEQAAEGEQPKAKRARSAGVDAGSAVPGSGGSRKFKKKGYPTSPASPAQPEGAAAASLLDVTVEDADVLDCRVFFHPLNAPIFQCDVGHVVCSMCCDKLKATGKCHVCGIATGGYHRRCPDMERLLDSIRVPCPYAAHGCSVKPVYHDLESHRLACVHAPCHCPGEDDCDFVGSKAELLDHSIAVHSWPCTTNVNADSRGKFTVRLQDGFNFLLTDCPMGGKGATAESQWTGLTALLE